MRELPKYKKETGDDNDENGGQEDDGEKKPLSDEFSEKTNQLLDYIEKTYLQGVIEDDPQGKNIIEKMRLDNTQKVVFFGQSPTHPPVETNTSFTNSEKKKVFLFLGCQRTPIHIILIYIHF